MKYNKGTSNNQLSTIINVIINVTIYCVPNRIEMPGAKKNLLQTCQLLTKNTFNILEIIHTIKGTDTILGKPKSRFYYLYQGPLFINSSPPP